MVIWNIIAIFATGKGENSSNQTLAYRFMVNIELSLDEVIKIDSALYNMLAKYYGRVVALSCKKSNSETIEELNCAIDTMKNLRKKLHESINWK